MTHTNRIHLESADLDAGDLPASYHASRNIAGKGCQLCGSRSDTIVVRGAVAVCRFCQRHRGSARAFREAEARAKR